MAPRESGFSILEMTVALTIMLAATAGVFALVLPSHGSFASQPEAADMQQRMRVAADAISRDLLMAGAGGYVDRGPLTDRLAPIRPYRAGALRADPPGTFKSDTITVLSMPRSAGAVTVQSATYWQQNDIATGTYQLMFYDGSPSGADVPVVDHVVALSFEYYGDPQPLDDGPRLVKLAAAQLTDGPWCPDDGAADRWDADLIRIRRVAVTLRVEAAVASLRGPASALFTHGGTSRGGHAWVPDIEVRFDISPRNLNLSR